MSRILGLLLLGATLQGCTGFQGVTETLNPSGPVSLEPYKYSLSTVPKNPGQVGLFEIAYKAAFSDAEQINEGQLQPPTGSNDPISIRARRMASEGVHLADSYCALFFAYGSDNQKWLLVSKDIVAALGTIATGAVALASPHNATAAGAIALTTAALYNGVDLYTRNFLFNTDNIDAVRSMTMNALAAHAAAALPENDSSIWTFGGAAQVVNEHQAICLPASIRSLVLAALKTSTFHATYPAAPAGTASTPSSATAATDAAKAVVPNAAAAVANAAPAAAVAAAPAANAAAVLAGPAAAAAAARPGADAESIRAAARAAAAAGARAAIAAAVPGASTRTIQAAGNAAANVVAPAAASGAVVPPRAVPPTAPPATRQLNLIPNATQ